MVQINFALREVNCKIVYYGPGMSGKTTNLEIIHRRAPDGHRGELTSIATEGDRTLFFDFMPLDLGTIAGMRTKFQLYTVPGQVYYNSTRKLVLQGVDGVVFVADSSPSKTEENLQSIANLEENLREYGRELKDLPHVIQYNKRDLPDAVPVAELEKTLNRFGAPTFEAVAMSGEGVFPTLKALAAAVLESINRTESKSRAAAGTEAAAAPPAPALARPLATAGVAAPGAAAPVAGNTGSAPTVRATTFAGSAAATGPGPFTGGRFSKFGLPADGSPPGPQAFGGAGGGVAVAPSAGPASAPAARSAAPAGMASSRPPASPARGGAAPTPRRASAPRPAGAGSAVPRPAALRPPTSIRPPAAKRSTGPTRSNLVYGALFGALVTAVAFGIYLLVR